MHKLKVQRFLFPSCNMTKRLQAITDMRSYSPCIIPINFARVWGSLLQFQQLTKSSKALCSFFSCVKKTANYFHMTCGLQHGKRGHAPQSHEKLRSSLCHAPQGPSWHAITDFFSLSPVTWWAGAGNDEIWPSSYYLTHMIREKFIGFHKTLSGCRSEILLIFK